MNTSTMAAHTFEDTLCCRPPQKATKRQRSITPASTDAAPPRRHKRIPTPPADLGQRHRSRSPAERKSRRDADHARRDRFDDASPSERRSRRDATVKRGERGADASLNERHRGGVTDVRSRKTDMELSRRQSPKRKHSAQQQGARHDSDRHEPDTYESGRRHSDRRTERLTPEGKQVKSEAERLRKSDLSKRHTDGRHDSPIGERRKHRKDRQGVTELDRSARQSSVSPDGAVRPGPPRKQEAAQRTSVDRPDVAERIRKADRELSPIAAKRLRHSPRTERHRKREPTPPSPSQRPRKHSPGLSKSARHSHKDDIAPRGQRGKHDTELRAEAPRSHRSSDHRSRVARHSSSPENGDAHPRHTGRPAVEAAHGHSVHDRVTSANHRTRPPAADDDLLPSAPRRLERTDSLIEAQQRAPAERMRDSRDASPIPAAPRRVAALSDEPGRKQAHAAATPRSNGRHDASPDGSRRHGDCNAWHDERSYPDDRNASRSRQPDQHRQHREDVRHSAAERRDGQRSGEVSRGGASGHERREARPPVDTSPARKRHRDGEHAKRSPAPAPAERVRDAHVGEQPRRNGVVERGHPRGAAASAHPAEALRAAPPARGNAPVPPAPPATGGPAAAASGGQGDTKGKQFGLSGVLAADSKRNKYGKDVKYVPPADRAQPTRQWYIHTFKDGASSLDARS